MSSSGSSTSDPFGTSTHPSLIGQQVQNYAQDFVYSADPDGDAYHASADFRDRRAIDPARPSCNGRTHTYRCGHTVRERSTACCPLCVFPRWGARKTHRRCDRCQRELHEFFLLFMILGNRWTFGALDNAYDLDGGHERRFRWVQYHVRAIVRADVWYQFQSVGVDRFIEEAWAALCETLGYDPARLPEPQDIFDAREEGRTLALPGAEDVPPEPPAPVETRREHFDRLLAGLDPYDQLLMEGLPAHLPWLLRYARDDARVYTLVVEFLEDEAIDADHLDREDVDEIRRYLPEGTRDRMRSVEAHAQVSPLHRRAFRARVLPTLPEEGGLQRFMRGELGPLPPHVGRAFADQMVLVVEQLPLDFWEGLHERMLEIDVEWEHELVMRAEAEGEE